MALLHDSVNSKKFDVRLVERNIARGRVTSKELEDALKVLPDDSENAEWVSIDSLDNDGEVPRSNGHSSDPSA